MADQISVPSRVATRITSSLKRFQPILSSALARDVNESDTSHIVNDMLSETFGYDKYDEITTEHQVRGTYCDLAVTIEGNLRLMIEVKAIGLNLKDKHLRQVVNYAANKGVDWVVLTNGVDWHVYKINFSQPINEELVIELNFLEMNLKEKGILESLYLLTKEGLLKSALPAYYTRKQATNRFILGAILLSDPVLATIRRELRRIAPDVKVSAEQVKRVLLQEVLKREVAQGEFAEEARKKVQRSAGKAIKARKKSSNERAVVSEVVQEQETPKPNEDVSSTEL